MDEFGVNGFGQAFQVAELNTRKLVLYIGILGESLKWCKVLMDLQ